MGIKLLPALQPRVVTWGTVYGEGFMNSERSMVHSRSSWDTWMDWIGGKRG